MGVTSQLDVYFGMYLQIMQETSQKTMIIHWVGQTNDLGVSRVQLERKVAEYWSLSVISTILSLTMENWEDFILTLVHECDKPSP